MTSIWFLDLTVSMSLQVAVVLLATHGLTQVTRDARTVCRFWLLGYMAVLGLVFTALLLPHPRWLPPVWGQLSRPAASELLLLEAGLGRIVFAIWLIGAVVLWTRMVVQSLRVARFLKTCQPINAEHAALRECQDELRDSTDCPKVIVLSSGALASPFCWQFHRPYIVLPEFLLGLGPSELRFILRHELAHLKTGHPLQLFLQRLIEVLFWFHPLVWWSSRRVSRSREFACDDAAIDHPAQVASYLRTLLLVVEHSAAESDHAYSALTFGRDQQIVADRARRLVSIARFGLSPCPSQRVFAGAVVGWLVAIAGCCFLWLPVDVVASTRSTWSPWPRWSANLLHEFGVSARDFEVYDDRVELSEILSPPNHAAPGDRSATQVTSPQ